MASKDVILASLLSMGIELHMARAAVNAGQTTVDGAMEWIFDNADKILPTTTPAGQQDTHTLRLGRWEGLDANASSTSAIAAPKAPVTINIKIKQADDDHDKGLEQQMRDLEREISQAQQQKAIQQQQSEQQTKAKPETKSSSTPASAPGTKVTKPLPLTSRHNEAQQEAADAHIKLEAQRMAAQTKKQNQLKREAKQHALNAIKEDRERRRGRQEGIAATTPAAAPQTSGTTQEPPTTNVSPPSSSTSSLANKDAVVQLRLKNGNVIKRSFPPSSTIQALLDVVHTEDSNPLTAAISLIQPFPRKEFSVTESELSLVEAGLYPSCSLNVFVTLAEPAAEELANLPGALPADVEMTSDTEGADGMEGIEQHESEQAYVPNDDDGEDQGNNNYDDDEDDDVDGNENENNGSDDDMMHALPVYPGHGGAGRGRGRGRGGFLPGLGRGGAQGGRGRGGGHFAFGGMGHVLTSPEAVNPSIMPAATTTDGDPENANAETDQMRRQRILDAMQARQSADSGSLSLKRQMVSKELKVREVPLLRNLCAYAIAVQLTKHNTKVANLSSIGSSVGELLVQELIKLNELDQMSFKKLSRCALSTVILDGYPRATDSLLEVVSWTQAASLTHLSLKGCSVLTEAGGIKFIQSLVNLEYLDLSHCRITDKILKSLENMPELATLSLSNTKITSKGLRTLLANSAWTTNLMNLNLSYCSGIAGPEVLKDLQVLTNLRVLKLQSTGAFDNGLLVLPDEGTFSRLTELDLSRTQIGEMDLEKCLPLFKKTLQILTLTECRNLHLSGSLATEMENLSKLEVISLPDRESDLLMVLPRLVHLPLTTLDFTGFPNLQDQGILHLAAAKNLTVLSLAGTKLTDRGATVLGHMLSLRELNLDRTLIKDGAMEYLRGLGRIEQLSLSRCNAGLTSEGILFLTRTAGFVKLRLKRLNLSFNGLIHDEALQGFYECKGLVSLNLDSTDVSEIGCLNLQHALAPTLVQLRMSNVTSGEQLKVRTFQARLQSSS